MVEAAENLRFEEAARLRDVIRNIEAGGQGQEAGGGSNPPPQRSKGRKRRR